MSFDGQHAMDTGDGAGAYAAFQEGSRLLAADNAHAAAIALEKVRDLEPAKGSVREALARARGQVMAAHAFGQAGGFRGQVVEHPMHVGPLRGLWIGRVRIVNYQCQTFRPLRYTAP